MTKLKGTYPSRRAFLVLDDTFNWRQLSLKAIGIWAHIEAQAGDVLDIAALQNQFPAEDVGSLIGELLTVGVLMDADEKDDPFPEPPPELTRTEPIVRPKVPGFVYVIESSGYYKIGITRNIAARIKQLQTGHFKPLELVWQWRCADPAALELRLHTILQPTRETGEWFACSREQLDAALQLGVLGHDQLP